MRKPIDYIFAAFAFVCACSPHGPDIAGTSEQGNAKFTATLYTQDGLPASGLAVILRRGDYVTDPGASLNKVASDSARTATDEKGFLSIDSLDSGAYCVEATDAKAHAVLLRFVIDKGQPPLYWGADTIRPFAIVKGKIDFGGSPGKRFAQVYGLERITPVSSSGAFVFNDLPQGIYTIRIVTADSAAGLTVFDSVAAKAGAIDTIGPYRAWKSRSSMSLNTSASGADVKGDAVGFPVLIRLTKSDFDFSSAMPGGKDVRFAKSDNTPLRFEIERWDAGAGAAEIWVRVDTVYGNSTTQTIFMFWGNPNAAPISNSAAVFDTANGFQGVWHLDNAGNAPAKDATGNGYDGTPYNMTAASAVAGAIGGAREFDGVSGYIAMTGTADSKLSFSQNGSYTVSAWAYVDTFDSKYHVIVGKGHEQYYLKIKCFGGSALWEFDEYEDKTGWAYTQVGNPPNSKSWVYLVGVRSGALQQLYINGELALDTFGIMAGTLQRNTGDDFTIGKYVRSVTAPYAEGYCAFSGKIDEVCVSSKARSADWIKLCYMNQRPDVKLVVFK